MKEVVIDAVLDSVRMLPFLFGAFCIIEILERYSEVRRDKMLMKFRNAGPVIGALFGCIPQCGFSVVAANLYSGGVITVGTLLSVFMSTSDEAILIMLGYPESGGMVIRLILVKVMLAVAVGYIIDLFFKNNFGISKEIHKLCDKSGCGCEENHGVVRGAIWHTARIFIYILIFTICLNVGLEWIGIKKIQTLLLKGSVFQSFLTAFIGLIPNCASSVLLAELYMQGIVGFAAAVAGLSASAGLGLVVLFKVNQNQKENFKILGLLYASSVMLGIFLSIV